MIDKQTFKKAITSCLKNAGLVKKGGQSWYLHGKDAVVVFNLQKSNWDDIYYINIGIWLKALGETSFPLYDHCHLSYRAERLFPNQRELVINSCSLNKSSIEYLSELTLFIENDLVPFLEKCTDGNYLKELFSQGLLDNGLVHFSARNYLTS